jgi:hypothetical protein
VRGVDPDAFRTFDLCKRRTLKDAIDAGTDLGKDESATTLATAVGYATAYASEKRQFIPSLCVEDERVAYLDDNPGIRDFAKLYKGRNRLRLSGGLLAACHYLFAQKECRFRARERMTAKLRTPLVAPEIV